MSLWSRITAALAALASGEPLSEVFARLRTPPERSVAFTIAVIGLGAKMAKADGVVTRNEVAAFRRVFAIPPEEEGHAAHVFNLARQDVAGYDAYARKIAGMFARDHAMLIDVMEGLFQIATADGSYADEEDTFLRTVAEIFGLSDRCFRVLRTRYAGAQCCDPYDILGVDADAPIAAIRAAWRQAVRDNHPDRLIARGVPEEAVQLAQKRLVDINRAWAEITAKQAA
ncbi:molecular chaperone DjiA [Falsirhodobacter halotolerans]|uniref:molecular chaperone DjiA n=1 Tax=Falsirhodobacter halotolerans TaxID=1146892 RepID=UPI001FD5E7F6|nr:molecular chaperone DjiA [Falsirhodobacter halotolerans]MCJ8138868.1 molecular chaperone DjiA [Falsirhodobacter halotolerans]